MRCVPITDCVRAVDDEAFMPMNCRFAKITVRMLGADAPLFIIVLFPLDNKMMCFSPISMSFYTILIAFHHFP